MLNYAFIKETGVLNWAFRTWLRQFNKRIRRRDHYMYLPTGNRFLLPIESAFASEVFITNANLDWGTEILLSKLLSDSGCFLDVGANIGYYSVYFEPLVERVYAFEPDPRPRQRLERNVAPFQKIEVVPAAVSEKSGTVSFLLTGQSEVSHIVDQGGITISAVSIDDFVIERDLRVVAIKTDVEGFDLDALRGAKALLESQRPLVVSELQPDAEVLTFAGSVAYDVFAFARDPATRVISFVQSRDTDSEKFSYKMLILVPCERSDEIRSVAVGLLAGARSKTRVVDHSRRESPV